MNFPALRKTSGVGKSLADILLFKVRKISEQFRHRPSRSNRFHDHADGHAHSSNARFAAHHVRIDRNAAKLLHMLILARELLHRSRSAQHRPLMLHC